MALVYLGVGAVFVPANLLLSAFLIGSGCKLVMKSAAPYAQVWGGKPPAATALRQKPGEIVIRQSTPMEKLQ